MTSFLITGRHDIDCEAELRKLLTGYAVDQVDTYMLSPEGANIGIEEIRLLQTKIMLRPIKSDNKSVVIWKSQLLTIPAQNALLKTLEEPPDNTLLILITESEEALLPTIRSRCQIIRADKTPEKRDLTESLTFLDELPTLTMSARLARAEKLAKNKPVLPEWFEDMLFALSQRISDASDPFELQQLRGAAVVLQETHATLKHTNTNPRLTLEHCLLTAFDLPPSGTIQA